MSCSCLFVYKRVILFPNLASPAATFRQNLVKLGSYLHAKLAICLRIVVGRNVRFLNGLIYYKVVFSCMTESLRNIAKEEAGA